MSAEETYLNFLCAVGRIAPKAFRVCVKLIEGPSKEKLDFLVLKFLMIAEKWVFHAFKI